MTPDTWSYRDSDWTEGGDLVGYDVEAADGSIGKIHSATFDTAAAYVVVDTGFWILGKLRLIPAGAVTGVDHSAETVTVSMTKDQIRFAPDYGNDSWGEESRTRHHDYYGPYAD